MADHEGLEGLEGLHRDLLSFSESQILNVERLELELQQRIGDFRRLLDKPPKNDRSRQELKSKTVLRVQDTDYQISPEFTIETIEVADALDLDELEAARLLIASQEEAEAIDRKPWVCTVIDFHHRRLTLLECLRIVFRISVDDEKPEDQRMFFREYRDKILRSDEAGSERGSKYWRRCLSSMGDIETWLRQLAERTQTISIVGQSQTTDFAELLTVQQRSLILQHDALSAISAYLAKDSRTSVDDFQFLLSRCRLLDRYDTILIHYVPIVAICIDTLGSVYGTTPLEEARSIHKSLMDQREASSSGEQKASSSWGQRNFLALTLFLWLVAYSGRYKEDVPALQLSANDLEKEAEERAKVFSGVLQDGALHLALSVCRDLRPMQWLDPAKQSFLTFLLPDSTPLPYDSILPSEDFQDLVMRQFQTFAQYFIDNVPEELRKLRAEENSQRMQIFSRFQRGPTPYELHLERFLVIISYAFADYPEIAHGFWDIDSQFYGFLQWAARRQSTPLAAAFCEVVRSISEGEECAEAAHRFLLEEGATASGQIRRTSSLSWKQMFEELHYYASNLRERPSPPKSALIQSGKPVEDYIVEPESGLMLQCYLKLITHLYRQSSSARQHTIYMPDFDIVEDLLIMCSSGLESYLRAAAYATMAALLTGKDEMTGLGMWEKFDSWLAGEYASNTAVARAGGVPPNPLMAEQIIFETVAAGFEESIAFVELLESLVAPHPDGAALNDCLPFAETLGGTYRMAGIEPYVDFALGRVFGFKSMETHDPTQLRMLQWHCLNFAALCLSSFNEDLIIFANRSDVPIDQAVRVSSLTAYVKLHPFARTMEWFFNDRVIAALFMATHHDVGEVNDAAPNSPLVMALSRAIEVVDLIMRLQATYLDIVRPLIKTQTSARSASVANFALASFEDAVLNNLQIVVDLGLYCGTGHQSLTLLSLRLLEKLSASRKLAVSNATGTTGRVDRSRLISVLEKDDESERVSRSLVKNLRLDERELEAGVTSPGFALKSSILAFLDDCLAALPNRPTLAHLLLGFSCGNTTLDIAENGLFLEGSSVFHAVRDLATQYSNVDDDTFISWRSSIRCGSFDLLKKLWIAPISSVYTLTELRATDFLFVQAIQQRIIGPDTLWDGVSIYDPSFLLTDASSAFRYFLQERSTFLDYVAAELRSSVQNNTPSLSARIQSTLLGTTVFTDGQQMNNPNIFDLFDFIEIELPAFAPLSSLELHFLSHAELEVCRTEREGGSLLFNLLSATQLIELKHKSLVKEQKIVTQAQDDEFQNERGHALASLTAYNQHARISDMSSKTLASWVRLVSVILGSNALEPGLEISFILQALQVIMPKLERSFTENQATASDLAGLARMLLKFVDFSNVFSQKGRALDFAKDRLSQLFRVAINGVCAQESSSELREICYQICFCYLAGSSKACSDEASLGAQNLLAVTSAGDRLIETTCDDAFAGQGSCRVSATMLLSTLVVLAQQEDSKYMIDSLVRLNFIGVLVDMIKHIPLQLKEADVHAAATLLQYYHAALALLLRVAKSRAGAPRVVGVGLFSAIRESELFAADPDIGIEMASSNALKQYFDLMLAIMRIVNAVILVNGPQHMQSMHQARQFLSDYRAVVVAVFKRSANIGGYIPQKAMNLSTLVDNFTVLISATGFLEHEENQGPHKSRMTGAFS
ncbi:MAG: hypothetical protein M1821_000089 [Bathelium mastoideum]|nr:MAG: hypothetical protein M1821_000089 [Bathelium mastoideum]